MSAQPLPIPELPRRTFARLGGTRLLRLGGGMLGATAIVVMVLLSLQIVGAAATHPNHTLVPDAHYHVSWLAGVFHGYGDVLKVHELTRLLIAIAVLYVVVLACSRWIPAWVAIAGTVVLTAMFALAPPLFSTDIFNYVDYARLGVIHHINPYQHGAAAFAADPAYRLTGHRWLHTPTAYGPLFTLITYALVPLGVGGAMWALKILAALAALGSSALVWACARRLGIRPVPAMLFFALNPLVLVYAVGGGHNDLLMVLLLAAGVFLIVDGKPEFGGAAIVAAAAIKLTAGLALPFVLVASGQRRRVLAGAAAAGVVCVVAGIAVFGAHITGMIDVLRNHDKLTSTITSVPGYVIHLLGGSGLTRSGRIVAQLLFGAGALALLAYAWSRRNWLPAAAGALALLVATLGWLLPWYAIWALPLAPLARKRWVPAGVLALTAVVLAIQIHIYNEHRPPAAGTRVGGQVIGVPGPQMVPRVR